MGIFPNFRCENKKKLKPPPRPPCRLEETKMAFFGGMIQLTINFRWFSSWFRKKLRKIVKFGSFLQCIGVKIKNISNQPPRDPYPLLTFQNSPLPKKQTKIKRSKLMHQTFRVFFGATNKKNADMSTRQQQSQRITIF